MKKLLVLALMIVTLSSCSFINDSEVQNTNTGNAIVQNSNSSTGTTRKIKNIKRVRTNSGITSTGSNTTLNSSNNIQTNNTVNDNRIGSSIEELSKISISEANINTETGITETGGIEDVSEEQVSQLVDILLEAGK